MNQVKWIKVHDKGIRSKACPGCLSIGTMVLIWKERACGRRVRWCFKCGTVRLVEKDGRLGFAYPESVHPKEKRQRGSAR